MENIFDQQQAILKFLGFEGRRIISLSLVMDINRIEITTIEYAGDLDETVERNFKIIPA